MNPKNTLGKLLILLALMLSPPALSQEIREHPAIRTLVEATGFEGTVLIHDEKKDTWITGDADLAGKRVLPASTFKIFSALVALETGVIADRHTIIRWDGVSRSRPEINRDLDLTQAFRLSAVPHFQQLVTRIGEDRMQRYIDAVGYGNRDISGGIDTFWLTGALRITAVEQIHFLRRLYHDELPFSAANMASVREMMLTEAADGRLIRAKTGWATPVPAENTGWWVGWEERSDGPVFFASMLQTPEPGDSFGPARLSLVLDALSVSE